MIRSIRFVDQVIEDAPLVITKEYIDKHCIHLVVHGFADEEDYTKQQSFFQVPISMNKFKQIQYYDEESSSDIMKRIVSQYKCREEDHQLPK